jgi:hypothetical protein
VDAEVTGILDLSQGIDSDEAAVAALLVVRFFHEVHSWLKP